MSDPGVTPMPRIRLGWRVRCWLFRAAWAATPVAWIYRVRGLRYQWAVWVAVGAYWWGEALSGRVPADGWTTLPGGPRA